jgi:hypothetical protein
MDVTCTEGGFVQKTGSTVHTAAPSSNTGSLARRRIKKHKRAKPLSLEAAIARVDEMIPLIEREIRTAIQIESSLETANKIVNAEIRGAQFYGAECFNTVKLASQLYLSVTLAKLFEVPNPRNNESAAARHNRSDVASIPLLVRLLRQKRCSAAMVSRAKQWMRARSSYDDANAAAAQDSIDQAMKTYDVLLRSTDGKAALSRLSNFRNKVLAHILLGPATDAVPTFYHLHLLTDTARAILQNARFAATGRHLDLGDWEAERVRIANAFWGPALIAAKDANSAGVEVA